MISNIERCFLLLQNANLDVQLAFDTYALITYIVSYIGKDETGLTKMLMECLKQVKGKPMNEQMKALKLCFVSHRQIGSSEAVYRILPGLHLKHSNISCIFVITGFPEKRQLFFKPATTQKEDPIQILESEEGNILVLEDEEDECIEEKIEQLHPEKVKIADRVGEYQQTITILDKYQRRPKYLENISLAQFAMYYVSASKIPKTVEFDESNEYSVNKMTDISIYTNETIKLPKYIKLDSMSGYMRCRTKPCVLRTHSSKKKEGAEQFYAEIQLFLPWRSEDEIDRDPEKCKQIYDDNFDDIIKKNRKAIYPFEEVLNFLDTDVNLKEIRPTLLYDQLDAQGEQDNEDDEMIGQEKDSNFLGRDPDLADMKDKPQFEEFKYPRINLPQKNDVLEMMLQLGPEQKAACEKVFKFCTESVIAQRLFEKNPESEFKADPLKLIVHGGAGIIN